MTVQVPLLMDAIRAHARRRPTSAALLSSGGATWTYAALVSALDALATRVRTAGITPSDTVALAVAGRGITAVTGRTLSLIHI